MKDYNIDPVSQEKDCICNEENPMRKVLCPAHGVIKYEFHSKAPEKYLPAQNHHENCRRVNCHCPDIEAPTDEGWEESFLDDFGYLIQGGREVTGKVLVYIRALVQKEREKAHKEGYLEASHDLQGERTMGKSEAFSLVRTMLEDYFKGLVFIPDPQATSQSILNKLSTLEGK